MSILVPLDKSSSSTSNDSAPNSKLKQNLETEQIVKIPILKKTSKRSHNKSKSPTPSTKVKTSENLNNEKDESKNINVLIKKSISDPNLNDVEEAQVMEAMSSLDSSFLMTPTVGGKNIYFEHQKSAFPPISTEELPEFDSTFLDSKNDPFNTASRQASDLLFDSSNFLEANSLSDSASNSTGLPPVPVLPGGTKNFDLPEMPSFFEAPVFKGNEGMDEPEITLMKTCQKCLEMIKNDGVIINGLFYHKSCCVCSNCGKELESKKCYILHEKLRCKNCVKKKKFNICSICNLQINKKCDEIKLTDKKVIHKKCLSCFICGKQLKKKDRSEIKGKIICKGCESNILERNCSSCHKPILGDVWKRNHRIFHPDCFKCEICKKKLHGNSYVIHHNKFLCWEHGTIYANSCAYCKSHFRIDETDKIKWNGKLYHNVCFVCRVCGSAIDSSICQNIHGRPHCKKCFDIRLAEGDCSEDGRNLKENHQHIAKETENRMDRFQTKHSIPIIRPEYGEALFETAVSIEEDKKNKFKNF